MVVVAPTSLITSLVPENIILEAGGDRKCGYLPGLWRISFKFSDPVFLGMSTSTSRVILSKSIFFIRSVWRT